MSELEIGDRVKATMNGEDWFIGTFVERSGIFAEFGIRRDDLPSEIRYFIHAEKIQEATK